MTTEQALSLAELASLAGVPIRTIRYYIQRGLLDRPAGGGRGAHYTARHLDQLLTVRRWTDAGLSLERILELAQSPSEAPPVRRRVGEICVRSHITVAPGVELVVSPDECGLGPEQIRRLIRQVLQSCRDLAAENDALDNEGEHT